jgi:hypothetical protein
VKAPMRWVSRTLSMGSAEWFSVALILHSSSDVPCWALARSISLSNEELLLMLVCYSMPVISLPDIERVASASSTLNIPPTFVNPIVVGVREVHFCS